MPVTSVKPNGRKKYIVIGIFVLIALLAIGYILVVDVLSSMRNPTGNKSPDYPYFITTEPVVVKKLVLPKGTRLTYQENLFRERRQDKMMSGQKLSSIELPKGETIDWGGVPVNMLVKFYNSEMSGFSVYPDFNRLSNDRKTKFSEIWKSCDGELGILVNNTDDWTCDAKNIKDISACGVNYQRYFKENIEQQRLLDKLYIELKIYDYSKM